MQPVEALDPGHFLRLESVDATNNGAVSGIGAASCGFWPMQRRLGQLELLLDT